MGLGHKTSSPTHSDPFPLVRPYFLKIPQPSETELTAGTRYLAMSADGGLLTLESQPGPSQAVSSNGKREACFSPAFWL